MNQKEKKQIIVYRLLVGLLMLSIAVVGVYAWFSINKKMASKGMQMKVQDQDTMHFANVVVGTVHRLDGKEIQNTYSVSGHKISLTSSMMNGEAVSIDPEKDDLSFLFTDLLPGEHVDITIGFYMDDSFDGINYEVALADFNVDFDKDLSKETSNKRFDLYSALDGEQYKHSLLGVFKWKPIKVVAGGVETDLSETAFSPMGTYSIGADDEIPDRISIYSGTWDKSNNGTVYYTFRLEVDFKPYYTLISKSSDTDIKNLLSEKQLSIGSIVLMGQ